MTSAAHELERDIDIDLGGLFSALWRKAGLMLIIGVLAAIAAFFLLQVVSPKYQSETRILIESRNPGAAAGSTGNIEQQRAILDQQGIASQVQIITSREVALAVIRSEGLELHKKKEFDTALSASVVSDVLFMLGLINDPTSGTPEERALKTFYEKLKVHQVAATRVINIQFTSKDAQLAALVPTAIAREYLRIQAKAKQGLSEDEATALKPQIASLRTEVRNAEARVAEYRASSGLLLKGRNNATLATQQLGDMSSELSRVRSQRAAAVAKVSAIKAVLQSGSSIDSISDVLSAPLIQRLRERQVTLRAQIAELSATLLPGHPRIKSLNSQLGNLNRQIRREARKILSALQNDARIARSRESTLNVNLNTLMAKSAKVGEEQVILGELEREATSKRDLLKIYLRRYSEAISKEKKDFLNADARVISGATVPSNPYFPKVLPIVIGAFFGSILITAMIVLAGALLRGRPQMSSHEAGFEAIAQADDHPSDASLLDGGLMGANSNKQSATGHIDNQSDNGVEIAARAIAMQEKARIALLSPEGEVGSEGSVLLARYLASDGASVIVIDMTGAGASSRAMIGPHKVVGIKDLLAGIVSFSDVIHSDRGSRAHIIPTGTASAEAAAIAGDRLHMIFDALENTYDFVIIDCGAADVSSLAKITTPTTITVINAMDENNASVRKAAISLEQAGFDLPLVIHPSDHEREAMGTVAA
jgi:uncharacterized protein involved in exopolysaccharide biosynthesis/Mrp family chromosome partitioning ATPase